VENILSYVLYGDKDRYWAPLPMTLIANSLIFPDFKMLFHIPPEIQQHRFFPILKQVSEKTDFVTIKVVPYTYKRTQPTLWRMMPLWDNKVRYMFCRDVDTIPVKDEVRSMRLFMQKADKSKYMIHGIRSYKLHTTYLMAGLSGFHCEKIREMGILLESFDEYMRFAKKYNKQCSNWAWGCDQEALKNFFYIRNKKCRKIMRSTLDTPLDTAPRFLKDFRATLMTAEECKQRINLKNIQDRHILFGVSKKLSEFAGAPIYAKDSLKYIKRLLDIQCPMSDIINGVFGSMPQIKEYYYG